MTINLTIDQLKILKRAANAGVGKQNEEDVNLTEDEIVEYAVKKFYERWRNIFERQDRDKLTYSEVKEKLAAREP